MLQVTDKSLKFNPETRFQYCASLSEVYGGQSGNRTRFCPSTSVSRCENYWANAPYIITFILIFLYQKIERAGKVSLQRK